MQRYDINPEEQRMVKKMLSEFLGFLKYKVESDSLTVEEQQGMLKLIEDNIPLKGTSEDFAKYFGQSPINVRSVICRKMLSKPVRKVMYSFRDFCKVIPNWSIR